MRTIPMLLVLLAPALALTREPTTARVEASDASALPAPPGPPAPEDTSAPTPTAAPASTAPPQAILDQLAAGDRLVLAGDHRGALPVYLDAVYAHPKYAPGRVRLGRAYLALRYPDRAVEQAELALALDPGSADAARLLAEAKAQAATGAAGVLPAPPLPGAPEPAKPRPEAEAKPAAATPRAPSRRADPLAGAAHYRAAIPLLDARDWDGAVVELSAAVAADPRLAVAYVARGSALFGLGRYMEAADDYDKAIALDPGLGTPVYGLAECYRMLGDGKHAAQLYDQYSRSQSLDVRDDLRTIAARRARELR